MSLVSKKVPFYLICLGQRYLPPDFMMTKDFLRQVLAEEKDFIKMEGLRTINVPHFDELSVKNIFPKFQQDPAVMRFLPNRLPKGKLPEREYFFNVLNTVNPEYTQSMIDHANKLRFKTG